MAKDKKPISGNSRRSSASGHFKMGLAVRVGKAKAAKAAKPKPKPTRLASDNPGPSRSNERNDDV